MIGFTGIGFAPLIDWRLVAATAAIGVLLLAFGVLRGARGSLLRLFALGVLVLALLNPHLEAENRRSQPDMAVVMVDESSSQNTGERRGQLARALQELRSTLGNFKDLRLKVVRGKETKNGTELFGELERAINDIPKGRFAGAVLLTDGQVHDVPRIGQKTIEEKQVAEKKYTVAIIGCGRLGQHYAEVYQTLPNTELVAIAEYNPERLKAVGERFGVDALYPDAEAMYREMVPDIAAVVLPGKYIKEAVIASAQAGVKGVSTDKPIAARLSDVDEMIEVCVERGVVFAGGNLQRALSEVQEAAAWLRAGDYGALRGVSLLGGPLGTAGDRWGPLG